MFGAPPKSALTGTGVHLDRKNVSREEVWPDPARQLLRIRRRSGSSAFESQLRAQERGGKTYLVREAFFESSREDLLRNDSLRGRLAAGLAVDLLAWARLIR